MSELREIQQEATAEPTVSTEDVEMQTKTVVREHFIKRMLKLKNFSLLTVGFAFFYFLIIYISSILVSNDNDGSNFFIPILMGFLTAFHFQYVYALRKDRNIENKEWNVDKIIWNSFVLLIITFATTVTLFFFMFKSRDLKLFDDFINELNPLQITFFIITIVCYFILFLMLSWHIIIHRTKVLSI